MYPLHILLISTKTYQEESSDQLRKIRLPTDLGWKHGEFSSKLLISDTASRILEWQGQKNQLESKKKKIEVIYVKHTQLLKNWLWREIGNKKQIKIVSKEVYELKESRVLFYLRL